MKPNSVKEKLRRGECAVGTMVRGFINVEAGQLFRRTGVDFALIDTEHTSMGIESVSLLCASMRMAGVPPIVRVPDAQYHLIARRLDAGASGIMVPRIRNRAEVEEVVRCAKYPPVGGRGSALRPLLTDYESTGSVAGDLEWINEQTFVCIQIETREAMESIDDLLSVPGVDATIMGPQDLSIALGVPGEYRHPIMEEAVDTMIAACNRHGVAPGIHLRGVDHLLAYKRRGMRLLACSTDVEFMLTRASEAMQELREG